VTIDTVNQVSLLKFFGRQIEGKLELIVASLSPSP
jgi:hypothetical protein